MASSGIQVPAGDRSSAVAPIDLVVPNLEGMTFAIDSMCRIGTHADYATRSGTPQAS
jgi:hypothetical protein